MESNKEELKREFEDKFEDLAVKYMEGQYERELMEETADWWLSRFSSYQNELREKLINKKKENCKWKNEKGFCNLCVEEEYCNHEIQNEILDEVLSLLTTKDDK